MMSATEVLDAYVRGVARYLPRAHRNDVAFELRALLEDELRARAEADGRAPDEAMVGGIGAAARSLSPTSLSA